MPDSDPPFETPLECVKLRPLGREHGELVMSSGTYFIQDCPTCGRSLRIKVEHLGRQLACQHCSGKLEARDPDDIANTPDSSVALLQRAEQLLNQTRIA